MKRHIVYLLVLLLGARTPVLLMTSLLCLVMAPVASASMSTQLFFDDFDGTALDTSRWSLFVDENGRVSGHTLRTGFFIRKGITRE